MARVVRRRRRSRAVRGWVVAARVAPSWPHASPHAHAEPSRRRPGCAIRRRWGTDAARRHVARGGVGVSRDDRRHPRTRAVSPHVSPPAPWTRKTTCAQPAATGPGSSRASAAASTRRAGRTRSRAREDVVGGSSRTWSRAHSPHAYSRPPVASSASTRATANPHPPSNASLADATGAGHGTSRASPASLPARPSGRNPHWYHAPARIASPARAVD